MKTKPRVLDYHSISVSNLHFLLWMTSLSRSKPSKKRCAVLLLDCEIRTATNLRSGYFFSLHTYYHQATRNCEIWSSIIHQVRNSEQRRFVEWKWTYLWFYILTNLFFPSSFSREAESWNVIKSNRLKPEMLAVLNLIRIFNYFINRLGLKEHVIQT